MTIGEIVKLIAQDGAAVVGFAVLLWVTIANNKASNRRNDQLLEKVLHGDGNGAPSIKKVLDRQDEQSAVLADHGVRISAIEQRCASEHGGRLAAVKGGKS